MDRWSAGPYELLYKLEMYVGILRAWKHVSIYQQLHSFHVQWDIKKGISGPHTFPF